MSGRLFFCITRPHRVAEDGCRNVISMCRISLRAHENFVITKDWVSWAYMSRVLFAIFAAVDHVTNLTDTTLAWAHIVLFASPKSRSRHRT